MSKLFVVMKKKRRQGNFSALVYLIISIIGALMFFTKAYFEEHFDQINKRFDQIDHKFEVMELRWKMRDEHHEHHY